jgi:hypothetical protein
MLYIVAGASSVRVGWWLPRAVNNHPAERFPVALGTDPSSGITPEGRRHVPGRPAQDAARVCREDRPRQG